MSKRIVKLANVVYRDHGKDDKIYIEKVQVSVVQFPFANRQVFVRFASGPAIDLSVYDMDRIVSSYLRLRNIKPPSRLRKSKKPAPCDFLV